jgi:hypothetical protein
LTDEIREENEKKKEYLNGYKNLCWKVRSLEEQLSSLREVEQSPKIQQMSDMPKGSKQTDLSDLMVREEALFAKIKEKRVECLEKKLEIEGRIADMTDGIQSSVLHSRYICCRTWDQIAYDLGYSSRQIINIHGKALIHFNIS